MNQVSDVIRVASVNWDYGGIDADGADARWQQTVQVLRRVRSHVVLCQELGVPQPGLRLARHVRRTANALGMEPVLGSVPPGARSALHTAVLVDTRNTGWRIEADGPYPHSRFGGTQHQAWCSVELYISDLDRPLHCYSVHLPARSAVAQLSQAQHLGALVAGQPHLVLIGGDFNSFPRSGPSLTRDDLEAMPCHPPAATPRNYDPPDAAAPASTASTAHPNSPPLPPPTGT